MTDAATFLREFFNRRQLPHSAPDGRWLYAYEVDEGEFNQLEGILRQTYTVTGTAWSREVGAALFLYAAEWWRRHYDGGRWSWNPILDSLGIRRDDWPPSTVRRFVEGGLRYWRLNLNRTGGLRYIGVIARQGGLPVSVLSNASGHIGRILGRVLELTTPGTSRQTLLSWVESLKDRLPASYQDAHTLELLTDLTEGVLRIVHQAGLTTSDDAIAHLDVVLPRWRRELPLRMDDTHAQGLFEQLIRDAVTTPSPRRPDEIVVRRWLESEDNDIWTLHSSLDLPNRLALDDPQSLFPGLDPNSLDRTPTLSLIAGDHSLDWLLHRLTGQGAYRVPSVRLDLSGEAAAELHQTRLRNQGGGLHTGQTRHGEALDPDLPWLFDDRKDLSPTWIRQGGGGVRTESAIVAIPAGWTVFAQDTVGSRIELVAFLESPERELYRLYGQAQVADTSGHRWTIRSAQVDADEDDYHWDGNRYWIDSIQPILSFRGPNPPSLRNGLRRIDRHDLDSHPHSNFIHRWGPVTVSHIEDGEIRHRARLLLLPERAEDHLIPEGPEGGSIRLKGWGVESARLVQNARTEEPDVTMAVRRQGPDMVIELGLSTGVSQRLTPYSVVLGLAWPGHPEEARVRFRYPAKGARAFDTSGRVLHSETWLSVADLLGVRLVAVGVMGPLRLMLEVQRPHEALGRSAVIEYPIKGIEGPGYIEVRLQDHTETIEGLLATEDLLDAWVKCVLLDRSQTPLLTLRLSRYTAALERFPTQVALKPSSLAKLKEHELSALRLYALRLESPADEPIELTPSRSEGVLTGAWDFDPTAQEAGSWLIYSPPDSPVVLRPLLWSYECGGVPEGSYAHAIGLADRTQREPALDALIARMSCNFLDPAWNELEHLISHLKHLPLASLDLWRRFAHNPRAMAALALRLGELPPDFVRRFTNELPFDWTLVPYWVWVEAAERLRAQCEQWFGANISPCEYKKQLENAFQLLGERYPALESLLLIVRCEALQESDPQFRIMRSRAGDEIFQGQQFSNENSEFQRFLREHANDDHWPTNPDISRLIQQGRKSDLPGANLLRNDQLDFQNSLINLPILLALRCIHDPGDHAFDDPQRIHAIRSFRAFDPDWFDAAFHCTIARCLSRGLFDS